ncbi:ParB N-terminal domain-containing protein [Streptomyces sp. SID5998]|nr:ParB N-terminal domain-containing protein [Streptomyces sp. SID5998]
MSGPACGNNPHHQLTDGDRQAVDSFRAYLTTRAELTVAAHSLERIRDAARLHRQQLIGTSDLYAVIEAEDATVQQPPVDRAALRYRIAAAIWERQNPGRRYADCEYRWQADAEADADAVLAVLPEPVGRAGLRDRMAEVLRPHASLGGAPLRHELPFFDGATPSLPRISGWRPLDEVAEDLAAVLPKPASRVEVWPLARVLAEVRCGSEDWSWDEEWADLDQRHAATGYLTWLEQQIRENGITMPVLIGSDGRLWDGHHRLRVAVRLGIGYVPVKLTTPANAVLPEPADRAAVLHETADDVAQMRIGAEDPAPDDHVRGYNDAVDHVVAELRRRADEAAATETEAGA